MASCLEFLAVISDPCVVLTTIHVPCRNIIIIINKMFCHCCQVKVLVKNCFFVRKFPDVSELKIQEQIPYLVSITGSYVYQIFLVSHVTIKAGSMIRV